jgi:hypothetical protein
MKTLTKKVRREIAKRTSKPVRMMFAEDFNELLTEHRDTCTDPNCNQYTYAVSFKGEVVTPMLKVGSPREVFLTVHSTPFSSIQLATGNEIKKFFSEDGTETIACSLGPDDHERNMSYVHPLCHLGHGIAMVPHSNGQVLLVCKTCGNGVLGPLQVAPRPKVEGPFVFCDYHGKQQSYLVCKHVLEGKQPQVLQRATDTESGEAICTVQCANLLGVSLEEFKQKHEHKFAAICAGHLNDRLNGKLEQLLVEAETVAA